MSNPAVIKLQQKKIGKTRVWLDDNLGESVHIHIDDIRVDLSLDSFYKICDDISIAINNLVNVTGFDINDVDPVYLETMLWTRLLDLKRVELDNVELSKMLAPGRKGIVPLSESRVVKALNGDTGENDHYRTSHHIGQDSTERLDIIEKSVNKNGYPWNNNYIIMYGSDNIIRDGQHRAGCLYKAKGNITVPVMRLFFENYSKENVLVTQNPVTRILANKIEIAKSYFNQGPRGLLALYLKKRKQYRNKKKYQIALNTEKKYAKELFSSRRIIDNK